ncbi:MAG: hypothetical protein GX293_07420 [Bacteroidales bacterium]|nr:hypothetical protein [Bacteroidales bacterium]
MAGGSLKGVPATIYWLRAQGSGHREKNGVRRAARGMRKLRKGETEG